MFKEFIDIHNDKATRLANQFAEEKHLEVKNFTAFADNLAKVHLIVEFENAKEETPAPKKAATKTVTKKTTSKASTATK